MLKEHPKGLLVLAITNMGERFGYYTMLAILSLYMQAKFGFSSSVTSLIYGAFLGTVYFLPFFGGIIADKVLGYGKTILLGISVMFFGYMLLAVPTDANTIGLIMMIAALLLISVGTGFFKGNLQALVGNLYESDMYKGKRDIAFSIFYMFINIGAFFAPSAANSINNAILARDNFTYDASIPNTYVKLNDKVVDEKTFVADIIAKEKPQTDEEIKQAVDRAKKKESVIFQKDRENILFKLKAAGLAQLTASGTIVDPSMTLSKAEYELLESRKADDKPAIEAVKAKINSIIIAEPKLYGDPSDPDKFAINFGKEYVANSLSTAYNIAFAIACISLIFSLLIFIGLKKTWKPVDKTHKQQLAEASKTGSSNVVVLTPAQVRERVIALLLVFFVVIFFWMSFHQNGLCMTFFARDYTVSEISPLQNMMFSLLALLPLIAVLYGIYLATMGIFGGKRNIKNGFIIALSGVIGLIAYYLIVVKGATEGIKITPQIFQQFNPLFIIILTPLSVGLFTYLSNKGKEPSAPRKIGIGMLVAAIGFVILLIASVNLPAPSEIQGVSDTLVSTNWLIGIYFVLTIAELFLSPMGLSFVAKVSPPQYKGMMQGGWLAATAIGNMLVGVMGAFWDKLPLYAFWAVLVICCLLSAAFIFSIMKRLERVTK